MSQRHGVQHGLFHITTNARGKIPWCTLGDVPRIILDNLIMTRNMQHAELYAFCILPDHVHIIMSPSSKGLSAFVHSWKRNTMRDVRRLLPTTEVQDNHIGYVAEVRDNHVGNVAEVRDNHVGNVAEVRNLRVNKYENLGEHERGRYGSSATISVGIDPSLVYWQKSFHDERIRDSQQRSATLAYIQGNAMKHGLVTNITDWPWTSLHFPELLDPMDVWLE
jgi:REP element-mobilizing transposase RayT